MDDTKRTGDWTGDEWAGDETTRTTETAGMTGTSRISETDTEQVSPDREGGHWNKEQWVGDQGEGAPLPRDPDTMPEGETSITGDRHTPGEQHWAPDTAADTPTTRE
jgi:hypothetical protein